MLYQVFHHTFRFFMKTHSPLLMLLVVVLMFGCNQKNDNETSKDFIKLDAPLEEVLPKITLVFPDLENENGKPIEIALNNTFSGEGEYYMGNGETHEFRYSFFKQHAIEGNRHIFAVVSHNAGGTGTYYSLIAIDKTTLKSVSEANLGDRVQIESVALTTPNTDTVSINYMDRESGIALGEPPDKPVEKHFKMEENQLTEVSDK